MAGKRKALLKKHEVQVAERRRTCKNSGISITKGELCLVVWDAQFNCKPYSKEVALLMISDARKTLDQIEAVLCRSTA
jgi:hypothetical protein